MNIKAILSSEPQQRKKQISVICLLSAAIIASIVCCTVLSGKLTVFFSDKQAFKLWLDSFGFTGKLIFVGIRAFQTVVKIIPAEPLEIGSGYAYGSFGGLALCSLGSLLGSLIIVIIVKIFGEKIVNVFVPSEKINSLGFLRNKTRLTSALFVIYLIPGTPKDVITYLIGVTDYSLVRFLLLTTVARVPSIITSTVLGAELEKGSYLFSAAFFAATTAVSFIGLYAYNRISKRFCEK